MNWLVRLTIVAGVLVLVGGCKSAAPQGGVDPNIAAVSTEGLRLGMSPKEVLDVSARRLYKEDQQNEHRLPELGEKERATIRLNRVRSLAAHESHASHAFHSNAVTLTLQFERNRLVQIEERHTGLGEADLRAEMKALSSRFKFVTDRTETGSSARWSYQGKNPKAYARIDFRFVPGIRGKTAPMSSYTIVLADPAWKNEAL